MLALLWVGLGGGIGSVLRYLLSNLVNNSASSTFPLATFGINVLGSFAIGIIYALSTRELIGGDMRLFLATGLCGGFTTFSTFSAETFILLRDGHLALALLYVGGSVVAGVCAMSIALWLMRAS